MEEFKQVQRALWGAGEYAPIAESVGETGVRLVERAGVEAGMDVLDVACGTGNAAIPAARAGARVTGLDLAPEMLEGGRATAAAAGVEIEWVEGDAEALPFDDGAFDRVLSTFGHMFAPRHRVVAGEMARVCRKGGTIGLCTWIPEGSVGALIRATVAYQPPPPDFAESPLLWGTEDHVRALFAPVASDFAFERHSVTAEAESVDAWADFFLSRFGPLVAARQLLGERFQDLRNDIVAVWEAANVATDGRLVFPQEYLLSVVRL